MPGCVHQIPIVKPDKPWDCIQHRYTMFRFLSNLLRRSDARLERQIGETLESYAMRLTTYDSPEATRRLESIRYLLEREDEIKRSTLQSVRSEELFRYKGKVQNAKYFQGLRYNLFVLAQRHFGKKEFGCDNSGIKVIEETLSVEMDILFQERRDAESFEDAVHTYIGGRNFGRAAQDLPIAVLVCDGVQTAHFSPRAPLLTRIYSSSYKQEVKFDNGSDECASELDSVISDITVVSLTPSTVLKLVDRENSIQLLNQRAERCHLMGQAAFPCYASDENNILYMSRWLHEHFDNIKKTDGISTYALRYVGDTAAHSRSTDVEVTVEVVFLHAEDCALMRPFFRESTSLPIPVGDPFHIVLTVSNPRKFKFYLQYKEHEIYENWRGKWDKEDDFPYTVEGFDIADYPAPAEKKTKRKKSAVELTPEALAANIV